MEKVTMISEVREARNARNNRRGQTKKELLKKELNAKRCDLDYRKERLICAVESNMFSVAGQLSEICQKLNEEIKDLETQLCELLDR